MLRALLVASCVLAAGCATPPPRENATRPEPHGPEVPLVPWPDTPPPCGQLSLNAPRSLRVGQNATIMLQLLNCGNVTIEVGRGTCRGLAAIEVAIFAPDQTAPWRLTPQGAVANDASDPCTQPQASIQIPPGEELVVSLSWDGTAADVRCPTPPCRWAAPPGTYSLRALAQTERHVWSTDVGVVLLAQDESS